MAATDRPTTRVNLSLPDDFVGVVDRLCALTGTGRATILRELLVESQASLSDLAKAIEVARGNHADGYRLLADTLRDTQREAGQMELEIRTARRAMMRKRKQ